MASLAYEPARCFGTTLEVAEALEIKLPYEEEMLRAWRVVHHRLLRRTFSYEPDEMPPAPPPVSFTARLRRLFGRAPSEQPYPDREIDERWLEQLLRKLIEASEFLFGLGLALASRADVKLPHDRSFGAERKKHLDATLDEALPPAR